MALDAIRDSLEGLPEDVAREYVEITLGEGSNARKLFKLDVTPQEGFELDNVSGLRSALGKERDGRRTAEDKLKPYDGLDVEKARQAMQKMDDMANWNPDKEVAERIQARERQLVQKHTEKVDELTGEIKSRDTQISKLVLESQAQAAIDKYQGSSLLLLPHVLRQTKLRRLDNGDFVAEVVDSDGIPRIGDSTGGAMTIDQLVAEMRSKQEYSGAFRGSGARGSGAGGTPPANGGGTPPNPRRGVKTIHVTDTDAINRNLDKIATGEITVVGGKGGGVTRDDVTRSEPGQVQAE